jgi:hypothetical protein
MLRLSAGVATLDLRDQQPWIDRGGSEVLRHVEGCIGLIGDADRIRRVDVEEADPPHDVVDELLIEDLPADGVRALEHHLAGWSDQELQLPVGPLVAAEGHRDRVRRLRTR